MNVIDVFCGCGGLSAGFLQAGYKVSLGIDSDEVATKTFKMNHHYSDAIAADINVISPNEIISRAGTAKIDVVIGGPPCQGFSLSGPRNFDDPRNKLYLSFIRLVEKVKPKAFLIENVPGIVSLYDGQIREQIIQRFSELGYSVNYARLTAADYGVPQIRNRVFFVGLLDSREKFNFPKPVLDKKNYITTEEAIGDLPGLKGNAGSDPSDYPNNNSLTGYQKLCRRNSSRIYNHIATKHEKMTQHIISLVPEGGNYKNLPEKYAKSRNFHIAWTRFHSKKPAPTIDTGHRHHFHYLHNRVPTVRECARLQSFPDTFIFYGNKSQQYRQVGNAVPPLLAKTVAEKLKEYL
ncbi:MAG: DNA cytosine methyltransferase [Planctomycetota bacterium]